MENTFDFHYGAWPERFYMFNKNGNLCKAGYPTNEFGYDRLEIISWLQAQKTDLNSID